MRRIYKIALAVLVATALAAGAAGTWYVHTKQPVRSGSLALQHLQAGVTVRYDERGVPHIQASNEADLYRALGYVHAQDRLFQMEMLRRLSQGELAEILGPKLLPVDKLFRTLGLRQFAEQRAAQLDPNSPTGSTLLAYMDGINQYQATHPAPLEFDLLGIPKRPFSPKDSFAAAGYMAYSFAAAFRTVPVLTYIRDQLGPDYLRIFDLDWHPQGVLDLAQTHTAPATTSLALNDATWKTLSQLGSASQSALDAAGMPYYEGSNAWAISGSRTVSGKPLLAGDPHIAYSVPAVWYEAQLSAPGFDLYGHFQALIPSALLGHNAHFGWSLTMFQNADVDLIAEQPNPANPNQIRVHDQWEDLQTRTETIAVKGQPPVTLQLRHSSHGPIINDAFPESLGQTPVAMWWTFLETENPMLQAFYQLNRADTLDKARDAVRLIHAPGLNVVWANTAGDIGWWAAAKLPIRPPGVSPFFLLDGSKPESDKLGFYDFSYNPQEENPARGYIVSANAQPVPISGVPVPGYYNLQDRLQRLDSVLRAPQRKWNIAAAQALQLDSTNGYGPRILKELMPILKAVTTDPYEKAFLEPLELWDGDYNRGSMAPLLFSQLLYEITRATMESDLGPVQFSNLLKTRALDQALPHLIADPQSPWWGQRDGKQTPNRFETVRVAWKATLAHLQSLYGKDLLKWNWGTAHTLTHMHPLGMQKPLDRVFNVGPFSVPGGRETPNNLSGPVGSAPYAVTYGPSTRRVIDFADPNHAVGSNPVGQSGILFDPYYADQALAFSQGQYVAEYLSDSDVKAHTLSTLTLHP